MTDTIEFCAPLTVNGYCIAEIEGMARIVSPFPHCWEISVYEAGTYKLISLDGIKGTDKDADFKAGLRTTIEEHLWRDCQDAVDAALAFHRNATAYRQKADQREAAE